MYKVRCSYCLKDILFEYQDDIVNVGKIVGKCKRCGTFSEFDTKTKTFTKTEKKTTITTK